MAANETVAVGWGRLALCAGVTLAYAAVVCWIVQVRSAPPPPPGGRALSAHGAPL